VKATRPNEMVAAIFARFGVDQQCRCACDECELERGDALARDLRRRFTVTAGEVRRYE
jgi:hypothetical protein